MWTLARKFSATSVSFYTDWDDEIHTAVRRYNILIHFEEVKIEIVTRKSSLRVNGGVDKKEQSTRTTIGKIAHW